MGWRCSKKISTGVFCIPKTKNTCNVYGTWYLSVLLALGQKKICIFLFNLHSNSTGTLFCKRLTRRDYAIHREFICPSSHTTRAPTRISIMLCETTFTPHLFEACQRHNMPRRTAPQRHITRMRGSFAASCATPHVFWRCPRCSPTCHTAHPSESAPLPATLAGHPCLLLICPMQITKQDREESSSRRARGVPGGSWPLPMPAGQWLGFVRGA